MIKSNKHIEIVRSNISTLSSLSMESCDLILSVLSRHFSQVGVSEVNNLADLEAVVELRPDLVFLGMEFIPTGSGEDLNDGHKLWISEYLEANNISHTGSGQIAHQLGRNKVLAKQRVLDSGLSTSPYQLVKLNNQFSDPAMSLTFPLFVKPSNRGGGLGVDSNSLVHSLTELDAKISSIATKFGSDSLVEQYLPGREFSVAILKDEYSDEYSAMPIELIAPKNDYGDRFLSGHVKSSNTEQAVEVTDEAIRLKVNTLALDVFHALEARDYGRVDIRLDENGAPHFLEVNLIPSLISGYGSFPKACMLNIGLEYEPMIIRITKLGLARSAYQGGLLSGLDETVFTSLENAFEPV